MFRPKSFLLLLGTLLVSACKNSSDTLFTRLDADDTGIAFNNFVEEDAENNVLKYGYFYNGGGVGAHSAAMVRVRFSSAALAAP